jgi:hypothetical protein
MEYEWQIKPVRNAEMFLLYNPKYDAYLSSDEVTTRLGQLKKNFAVAYKEIRSSNQEWMISV